MWVLGLLTSLLAGAVFGMVLTGAGASPGPNANTSQIAQPPRPPKLRRATLRCGVLAVVVPALATVSDAGWLGNNPYRVASLPATFFTLGLGLLTYAMVQLRQPAATHTPMHSGMHSWIVVLATIAALGMVGCGGLLTTVLALAPK